MCGVRVSAEQEWISLTSPHFEMFTTNAQAPAAQELQNLDDIRAYFASVPPFNKGAENLSVEIIAFHSEAEYTPFAFRSASGAYSLHTFNHDYMVLPNLAARERELVAHEFAHLVVEHAGFVLPIWLNEGIAELYSTLNITDERTTLGQPPSHHIQMLHRQQWIPWDVLFAVDVNSPYYRDGKQLVLFYGQSWALVHMLALSEDYSPNFAQFLSAVSGGQTTSEALQSVYHRNLNSIQEDLAAYLNRRNLPEKNFPANPQRQRIRPVIGEPSDFQLHFTLANVLSTKQSTFNEAQIKLTSLSAHYPDQQEPEEVLGALAIEQNRKEEARRHLAVATERHSRNAAILCQYAALQQDAGVADEKVGATLRQAVAAQPEFEAARLRLGLLEAQDSHFESALGLLSNLTAVARTDEYDVYSSLAQCYLHLDHLADAKRYGDKAQSTAKTPEEKKDAADFLVSLEGAKSTEAISAADNMPPTVSKPVPVLSNVWGRAKALDCSNGQRRLRVDVSGRDMIFSMDNPKLVVRNARESYSNWQCGPLKSVNLTIVFTAMEGNNEGEIRELVFADSAVTKNPATKK